jgi:asparagine synthetase B (glutamine-hydrolysing)
MSNSRGLVRPSNPEPKVASGRRLPLSSAFHVNGGEDRVPGAFAAFGVGTGAFSLKDCLHSVDLLDNGVPEYVSEPGIGVVGASRIASLPRSRAAFEGDGAFMCCAGNAPGAGLPWQAILADLRGGTSAALEELSGRFAILCWDRAARRVHVITDHIGQHPVFYHHGPQRFIASTSIATFCRALPDLGVEPKWLYETFAFNFPVSAVTPLRKVLRVAPATVITYRLDDGSLSSRSYAPQLALNEPLLGPERAAEQAIELFRERVPLYLNGATRPAMGVTSGFDSRTILAFIARHPSLITFTYGVPGCDDVLGGAQIARALSLPFRHLPFDAKFETRLPDLMRSTVYLSSGMQGVNRATLLDAYQQLAEIVQPPDVVLSGVSGDQLFRGHGNVPSIVSPLMDVAFRTGYVHGGLLRAAAHAFGDEENCIEHANRTIADLSHQMGTLRDPLTHLRYLTYITPSRYFSGETSIADHFFDFRSPFCDLPILKLAYGTTASTLGLSKFAARGRLNHRKNYLPARLVCTNETLAALEIHGRPTTSFTRRAYLPYYAHGALLRLRKKLQARRAGQQANANNPPLEAWSRWFKSSMRRTLQEELQPGARIEQFVRRDFIDEALRKQDPYWLNKLVSTEIVLKLAAHGWRLPDSSHATESIARR